MPVLRVCEHCDAEFESPNISRVHRWCSRQCYEAARSPVKQGPNGPEMQCTKCGETYPMDTNYFYRRIERPLGFHRRCIACVALPSRRAIVRAQMEAPEDHKVCSECFVAKPADTAHFYAHSQTRDGIASKCMECNQATNKRRVAERGPAYLAELERLRKKHHSRTPEERERQNALAREWNAKNPDKRRRYHLTAAARRTPEQVQASKETQKAWRATNPEKVRAYMENYRARKAASDGQHTGDDVAAKYREQRGHCHWCWTALNGVYEVDHVIPLSKGGSNGAANICCSCTFCNRSKADKMPWEFADRLF